MVETNGGGQKGTGFAIARNGWLLTTASVVGSATDVTVRNRAFGGMSAKVVAVDNESDLALLRAPAVPAPLVFARNAAKPGDIVSSATANARGTPAIAHGALSTPVASDGGTVTHNALFDSGGYGSPLINECGEVVGVNRTDPTLSENLASPRGYAIADTPDTVKAFVSKFGVVFSRAAKTCVPAVVRAVSRAKAADERAQAAENMAAVSQQASVVAQRKADAAKDKAATADAAKRGAQALARQRLSLADRIKRLSLWGAIAAAAALLLIVAVSVFLVLRSRKRRRVAEHAASNAAAEIVRATTPPSGARDILLEGKATDGERFAIKIPALALGETHGGAVIGRNPGDAEFIVNKDRISRRHCRLFVRDTQILVEDLGSTNGTKLNGLPVKEPEAVHDRDTLDIGDVLFQLRTR
ncbi:MAG: trypsin-like peptidase domain-containing protein [Rhizomicrobium sp.]